MMVIKADIGRIGYALDGVSITITGNEAATFNWALGRIPLEVKELWDTLGVGDVISINGLAGSNAVFNGDYTVTATNQSSNTATFSRSYVTVPTNPTYTGSSGQNAYLSRHAHLAVGTHIFPADRCTWIQGANTGNGYSVSNVYFYPGNEVPVVLTNGSLGFIGKSGRFVEIAS